MQKCIAEEIEGLMEVNSSRILYCAKENHEKLQFSVNGATLPGN